MGATPHLTIRKHTTRSGSASTMQGSIAGYYRDQGGSIHGFTYAGGVFTQVDVPGATATFIFRINNKKNVVGYVIDSLGEAHGIIGQSNPQEKLHDSKAASLAINFWTDIFLWSKSSVAQSISADGSGKRYRGNCKNSRAQEARKAESLVLARLLEGGRLPGSKKIPTLADFSNRFFN